MNRLPCAVTQDLARHLAEEPRPGQTWRTAAGHLIKIVRHYGPTGNVPFPHHGEYVGGSVNGYRRMTFAFDGAAAIGGDHLVELVA